MSRFVIFLDVDGVLHPAVWRVPEMGLERQQSLDPLEFTVAASVLGLRAVSDGSPFRCLRLFEQTVRPYLDDLEIVITSSWRLVPETYDAVLLAMSPEVRGRVAGVTSNMDNRPWEIRTWLEDRNDSTALPIVIDDEESYRRNVIWDSAVLIFTQTGRGFVDKDSQALASILSLSPASVAEFRRIMGPLSDDERLNWVRTHLPISTTVSRE